jgi:16S rRNA (guanine527-N7)-methyltransferase
MKIITRYFNDLSPVMINQFSNLYELYAYWNEKINVISRKDIQNLYTHHILHSLSIAKIIKFSNSTKIMDVGTGGGFPAIPLAIHFPDVNFYLIDSVGKKIKVVNAIVHELGLKNVVAEQIRAQEVTSKYDFILSRAVMSLPEFINLVNNKIGKEKKNQLNNGILYLKGGDLSTEINQIKQKYRIFKISDFFVEEYFKNKVIVHVEMV